MTPTKEVKTIDQTLIVYDMLIALGYEIGKMTMNELFDVKRAITETMEKIEQK
jgi:hypothetical protein